MQGLHVFDPRAAVAVDLESLVQQDHLLRKVDRILKTPFIRELTVSCYASGLERPSIDPEVFFRMLVVAYLYDIRSDRQLCEDVHLFAYRWFCRLTLDDKVPDHSSLNRIRDRYGVDIFESLFRRIVEICQKRGLVAPQCRVITDATLIPANAALDSLVHNDPEQARHEAELLQGRTKSIHPSATRKISNQTSEGALPSCEFPPPGHQAKLPASHRRVLSSGAEPQSVVASRVGDQARGATVCGVGTRDRAGRRRTE
jgi:transposase